MNILVTGGAGFIGSALIRHIIRNTSDTVLNLDKLTYAANLTALEETADSDRYQFEKVDICDNETLKKIFESFQPERIIHLAAESHVDRSISGPAAFIQTNMVGTYTLLEVARQWFDGLEAKKKKVFRFHHVSTDEVYGDLEIEDSPFNENNAYKPSSPYSASKASSDHLVRAWYRTYGLPVVVTNCSNNYGPYQHPEKLIPLMISQALKEKPLPVYGDGQQIRDWLYVDDHARALYEVAKKGVTGETYNIGGGCELANIDVVEKICSLLDELVPIHSEKSFSYKNLISFVQDRPGHDRRYAIDNKKIRDQLGWEPEESFESGLRKTVLWYSDK